VEKSTTIWVWLWIFSKSGSVKIDMSKYVKMVLHDIPNKMVGTANTPAANHLFEFNDDCKKSDDDKKSIFIHYVMQLLYLSQSGRPDIRSFISFLCTRLTMRYV
jgi:hypothetical protein